nr:uncharacterized protein LOC123756031 [Procambarus clarkii]
MDHSYITALTRPTTPLEVWTSSGNIYIITVLCPTTRFPIAVPVKNITAATVVKQLLKIFTQYGSPKEIQSVCGTNFTSDLFKKTLEEFHITQDMLKACTAEAPFLCSEGKLYLLVDVVATASSLWVLFAQAFMSHVESSIMQREGLNPSSYCRHVDDIFVFVDSDNTLESLYLKLREVSGLRFTVEKNERGRIPFLDVLVDGNSDIFVTDVYRKPTDKMYER